LGKRKRETKLFKFFYSSQDFASRYAGFNFRHLVGRTTHRIFPAKATELRGRRDSLRLQSVIKPIFPSTTCTKEATSMNIENGDIKEKKKLCDKGMNGPD
jgi:hypothetical protein